MARKINPRDLLNDVLKLISKDVEEIEKLAAGGKLEGEVASTLVKYSDALLKIVKDKDSRDDDEKRKLASMSTEELMKLAQEFTERLKKK